MLGAKQFSSKMVLKIMGGKTMMTRRRGRLLRSHWRRLLSLIPEKQYESEVLFALLTGNVAEGRMGGRAWGSQWNHC